MKMSSTPPILLSPKRVYVRNTVPITARIVNAIVTPATASPEVWPPAAILLNKIPLVNGVVVFGCQRKEWTGQNPRPVDVSMRIRRAFERRRKEGTGGRVLVDKTQHETGRLDTYCKGLIVDARKRGACPRCLTGLRPHVSSSRSILCVPAAGRMLWTHKSYQWIGSPDRVSMVSMTSSRNHLCWWEDTTGRNGAELRQLRGYPCSRSLMDVKSDVQGQGKLVMAFIRPGLQCDNP